MITKDFVNSLERTIESVDHRINELRAAHPEDHYLGLMAMDDVDELRQGLRRFNEIGQRFSIKHDGFIGTCIGHYQRRDSEEGVVLQQDGTNVVHVYRRQWITRLP